MGVLHQMLGEGALLVARQLSTDSPSSTPTPVPSSTNTTSPQTPPPTATNKSNDNSNSGGSSSPLLFFVALGFGVVFTNLWIIVGVKYCFRYNARNRARASNQDGEPITLETVHRPRRRREKKLMTMDEVNEKFPMMKYKTWVLERAREGLPTAGGVSVPPSRANSLRRAEGVLPEIAIVKNEAANDAPPVVDESKPDIAVEVKDVDEKTRDGPETTDDAGQNSAHDEQVAPLERTPSTEGKADTEAEDEEDEDEDDEHIETALPPECLTAPGDSCAICIDTLEDDGDIRGLTCGHAFHAVCLDPWLTSRRACCPLCKADYYTPKPRFPGDLEIGSNRLGQELSPSTGGHVDANVLHGTNSPLWGTFNIYTFVYRAFVRIGRRRQSPPADPVGQASRFGGRPPAETGGTETTSPTATETVTPSQLEAGNARTVQT